MVNSDWLQRAEQGDAAAIAQLITQSLQTDGVTATAQRQGAELQIMLASAIPLDQALVMDRIRQGMERLAVAELAQVKVYSKRTDSDFPDWSSVLDLPRPNQDNATVAPGNQELPSPTPSASSPASPPASALTPQPESDLSLSPSEERLFSILAHLGPLLGYLLWLGNDSLFAVWGTVPSWLLGRLGVTLLILFTKGKDSSRVKAQAKEALNFQISMAIYWLGVFALCVVLIGFLLIIPLALFEVICILLAAIKSADRQLFRYPLNLRLIK